MDYRFGPFTLSTDRLLLLRKDAAVALEPQVFALLRLLVENHDRVVTRDEIFEAIWHGRHVSDAALSSRIKVARAALGDDGVQQAFIRTVHGHGFHFVADVETSGRDPDNEARPSLAILPTETISPSDAERSFAAGFEDDLVTALGKMRTLHVARARGDGDLRRHAQELGVRYFLSTRMRFSGQRFRMSASLIQVARMEEVWNEQFEGEMDDPFLAEDRLSSALQGVLLPNILAVEIRRAAVADVAEPNAYLEFLKALRLSWVLTKDDTVRAMAHLESSLALDSDFALAHGLLSWCHGQHLLLHWSDDPRATFERLQFHAQTALQLADRDTVVLAFVANAKMYAGDYDAAVHLLTKALEQSPNFAWAVQMLGSANLFLGQVDAAIENFHRALRLSPQDPIRFSYQLSLGTAYYAKGDYASGLRWLEQGVIENPNPIWGPRMMAACAAELGDSLRTERSVAMIRRQTPDATAESIVAETPPSDNVIRPRLGASLEKAGL